MNLLSSELLQLAWSSIRFSALSTVLAGLAGIPLGIVLASERFPGRRVLIVLFDGLMALPTVVVGLFVYSLFSRSGPLGFVPILFTPIAVIVGQALFLLPTSVSLATSGLSHLDTRFRQSLITLAIPRSRRYGQIAYEGIDVLYRVCLTAFGRGVGEVGVSMMLGGNIRWYTRTLTTAIVLETGKGEFRQALSMGIVLILISVFVFAALHVLAWTGRSAHRVRSR